MTRTIIRCCCHCQGRDLDRHLSTGADQYVIGSNVLAVQIGNLFTQVQTTTVGCVFQCVMKVLFDQLSVLALVGNLQQFLHVQGLGKRIRQAVFRALEDAFVLFRPWFFHAFVFLLFLVVLLGCVLIYCFDDDDDDNVDDDIIILSTQKGRNLIQQTPKRKLLRSIK